jgi:hypothetical protein
MSRTLSRSLQTVAAIVVLVAPMVAQRPVSAKFDLSKRTTLKGIVTRVDWSNPHVHILMNVQDGAKAVSWAVEVESQLELERSSWSKDSLLPGDAVTVQGPLARDGSRQIWGDNVVLAKSGSVFSKCLLRLSRSSSPFAIPNRRVRLRDGRWQTSVRPVTRRNRILGKAKLHRTERRRQ